MSTKPAVAPHQHDISDADLVPAHALDHQRIAGPHAWQHAPARSFKLKVAERAQNLARKIALYGGGIRRGVVTLPHDTFGFIMHWLCVPSVILPQVNAEVTKICS